MKKYKYKNYEEYVNCQKAANKKKSKNVWAKEENIKCIAEYIDKYFLKKYANPSIIGTCKFGLCHGVRQGLEQKWFTKYLRGCCIIGTEVGETKGKDIIKWDFNKTRIEWIGKFDFIYSNSFDHAYDPESTINVWADQLKPGGLIILEYDRRQEHTGEISKGVNKVDPISIRFEELIKLIPTWIKRPSEIINILDMPIVTQEWRKALIIEVK
jgi:hypothetical protein